MGKKILLAVDDAVHSRQAVKYAATVSSAANDVTYTLFNMLPLIPRIFMDMAETDPEVKAQVNKLVRKDTEAAGRVVEEFKDLMVREGIPENRIETVTEPIQLGLAKDILKQAEQGFYDAIVVTCVQNPGVDC